MLLNPHLSPGTKDVDASRIFYEPLCSFDPDGNLLPVLAAEVPTLQNGGIPKDGLSVTWKLKKDVAWHDGKPFTADDIVFTWEYAADPATAAVTSGAYKDIARIDKLGQPHRQDHLQAADAVPVRAVLRPERPGHAQARLRALQGREVPGGSRPTSSPWAPGPTGSSTSSPVTCVRAELNPNYHMPNWPFFDTSR